MIFRNPKSRQKYYLKKEEIRNKCNLKDNTKIINLNNKDQLSVLEGETQMNF
jgi:hypothetical protein